MQLHWVKVLRSDVLAVFIVLIKISVRKTKWRFYSSQSQSQSSKQLSQLRYAHKQHSHRDFTRLHSIVWIFSFFQKMWSMSDFTLMKVFLEVVDLSLIKKSVTIQL